MRIEPRKLKQKDGTFKHTVIIVCETEEEQKILDTIGSPKECEKYDYHVYGELRLADGYGEFYVHLENRKHDYYREDLDFLGETADGVCPCEDREDGKDCVDMYGRDCPRCAAGAAINEAGEVIHNAARIIRKEQEDAG